MRLNSESFKIDIFHHNGIDRKVNRIEYKIVSGEDHEIGTKYNCPLSYLL
jgi:hypothetical protein